MQFEPLDLSYVVPVRWRDGAQRDELADYLARIAPHCAEVIVVDGSAPDVFAANAAAFGFHATHVPPWEGEEWLMGKVAGVRTGIELASRERVVIADDDVRYEPEALRRAAELLGEHDLVRPQNYFDRLSWHARWDTARTLLNRSLGRDYPGTLAVRRSRMLTMGMYDGDVLFENLELMRTVRAHGGSVTSPLDLYVARVPPSAAHFWGQRTRQAYDDFALPLRMALWLAVVPLLALAVGRRRPSFALAPAVLSVRLCLARGPAAAALRRRPLRRLGNPDCRALRAAIAPAFRKTGRGCGASQAGGAIGWPSVRPKPSRSSILVRLSRRQTPGGLTSAGSDGATAASAWRRQLGSVSCGRHALVAGACPVSGPGRFRGLGLPAGLARRLC